MTSKAELIRAVTAAQAGDCETAHHIAQACQAMEAKWLHAVLHKIEGDVSKSHYWYAQTPGKRYDDFSNTQQELIAIAEKLKL